MKVEGHVEKDDLGPGGWTLVADDGRRFALQATDAARLVDGQRVVVEGKVQQDAVGIGMTGDPALRVERWAPTS
jgi:hypothetical protein